MAYKRYGSGFNEFSWGDDNMDQMNMFEEPGFQPDYRNKRYSDAFGDYSGGYGPRPPPLGFGPPPRPKFWPGPQQQFIMGRGFGPRGPPSKRVSFDDRAIKYLLRCGVAKDALKNLPRELLQLLEPQYCGICNQSFDSFPTSRLHYISKNHLKSQKRWLSLRSDSAGMRKEAPLKARELYCELCDVHITSKQHAESHYAGKPHRAIVEGRKHPRNTILLQKNMSDRLDQLIRREKKHLKHDNESGNKNQQEKILVTGTEIKSELFCDICKTSVTCTEQMTMHLNGKKHLTKEKQHILRMMKAGAEKPVENAEENTADSNAGEKAEENSSADPSAGEKAEENSSEDPSAATEEDANEKDDAEDNFDWGNGSSAWDETAPDNNQ